MLLSFQIISVISITVFFYFGYDMKRRSNWKTLAPSKSILLMKTMAVILGLILYGALFAAQSLKSTDFVAMILFITGALLVRAAKKELEKNNAFTWTGYALEKPNLVTTGIYKYIRHPLYTGVYLTEIGGVIVVLSRTSDWFPENALVINLVLIVGLAYAMVFNSLLAGKESKNLENLFGDAYKAYSKKVHPFIPFQLVKDLLQRL